MPELGPSQITLTKLALELQGAWGSLNNPQDKVAGIEA